MKAKGVFIHLFKECVLSDSCVPDLLLGPRKTNGEQERQGMCDYRDNILLESVRKNTTKAVNG